MNGVINKLKVYKSMLIMIILILKLFLYRQLEEPFKLLNRFSKIKKNK